MFKRKLFALAAIFIVVLLVGAVGCTAADVQALQGTLKNVDSVSGTVTVTLKDGTTRTFNFTDVKVDTVRQALGGASLEIGDQVTIRVHKNGKVEELDVNNAEVDGVIKSLGPNSVVITTDENKDITVNVTSDTVIRIEDEGNATFADLKAGQKVEVKYDVSNKNALRINIQTDEQDEAGEINGSIKAIDTVAKTVTITTQKKGDITLKVTPETIIRIEDHRTAALSDLIVGQQIEVRYDATTMNALKIKVDNNQDERDGENNDEQDNRD